MKPTIAVREILIDVICFTYILLFVYAAVNKFIDFDNFQVQLAQSPLLSSFAGFFSYSVPIVEVLISIGLALKRFRYLSIYLSLSLMVMFSAYIFIILHYSPYVPCSCGGILEDMSWKQHLVFNIAFVLIAIGGIILFESRFPLARLQWIIVCIRIFVVVLCSAIAIAMLFVLSEDMIRKRNNFTRRFPQHPAVQGTELDLKANYYYIAGTDSDYIYLGNIRSATTVTAISKDLKNRKDHLIVVPDPDRKFRSLTVLVEAGRFYLYDGTQSFVYSGSTADWKASLWTIGQAYFNFFRPIDDGRAVLRSISSATHQVVLGTLGKNSSEPLRLNDKILTKQVDGSFDTDGFLLYNSQLQKVVYLYAYRNEYIITDPWLQGNVSGRTIDTNRIAKIKVGYVPSLQAHKLASPGRVVNRLAATYGRYLYVNSTLIGKYEERAMWDQASIIDVYDLTNRNYVLSFYLYDEDGAKVKDFIVTENDIFVLAGHYLVSYQIEKTAFKRNTIP